jgi:hypothetical protein
MKNIKILLFSIKFCAGFDIKTNTFGKEEAKGDGKNMQWCVNWQNPQTKLVRKNEKH